MIGKRASPTSNPHEDLARQVADRLLEIRRENRRRFWRQIAFLVTLLGAVSGFLTLLVMLWERWF